MAIAHHFRFIWREFRKRRGSSFNIVPADMSTATRFVTGTECHTKIHCSKCLLGESTVRFLGSRIGKFFVVERVRDVDVCTYK